MFSPNFRCGKRRVQTTSVCGFSNNQLLCQIKPIILALDFMVSPLLVFVKSSDPWGMANTDPEAIIWAILVEID